MLRQLGARAGAGGPLSEVGGVAWIKIPEATLEQAIANIAPLGYTASVELVSHRDAVKAHRDARVVRWKGRDVALARIYDDPDESMRANAPDRRRFLLECADGVVRSVPGYRGGRGPLQHRGLPVEDARLLVNLAAGADARLVLDPFAGSGGVILAAKARGMRAIGVDIDPALRFGLAQFADLHVVGDAASMPFRDSFVDAVASEPPYDASALGAVLGAIAEIARVIRPGGRAALLLAPDQLAQVRRAAADAGLIPELESAVNRKGTRVACVCWRRGELREALIPGSAGESANAVTVPFAPADPGASPRSASARAETRSR